MTSGSSKAAGRISPPVQAFGSTKNTGRVQYSCPAACPRKTHAASHGHSLWLYNLVVVHKLDEVLLIDCARRLPVDTQLFEAFLQLLKWICARLDGLHRVSLEIPRC
eukprot:1280725-Amorphochlora_amoeboformis.AAC.1